MRAQARVHELYYTENQCICYTVNTQQTLPILKVHIVQCVHILSNERIRTPHIWHGMHIKFNKIPIYSCHDLLFPFFGFWKDENIVSLSTDTRFGICDVFFCCVYMKEVKRVPLYISFYIRLRLKRFAHRDAPYHYKTL